MKLFDVNVLVNALRTEADQHPAARTAIAEARVGQEAFIILPEVASGFLRIVTSPRIFTDPEDSEFAMSALAAWCSGPGVRIREAGPGRWPVFAGLMAEHQFVGGDVHDAMLAAACLDLNAVLLTSDRGFLRFPELRVELV